MQTVPKAGHQVDRTTDPTLRSAAGLRRITPAMLPTEAAAERFAGGNISPGQALGAFKSAAPYLGILPRAVHAIDWLFRYTEPQDWQPGARPIVWPSSTHQAEALGMSVSQAQRINRYMAEQGLIVMRDSPNGKRYGRRDRTGRIVQAYGFDLSPIADRIEEFREAAAAGRAEREAVAGLRRRATIARTSLRQTWQTYADEGVSDPALPGLKVAASAASQALRGLDRSDRLTPAVEALEAAALTARKALEMALLPCGRAHETASDSVEMRPKGRMDAALITATNELLNPSDTVVALGKCSFGQDSANRIGIRSSEQEGRSGRSANERADRGSVLKIRPDELIRIAPRLKPYLRRTSPSWPEIVDAADWLRHDLGISKPLWGDACLTMGREQAAIAVAIVSAKPIEHFRTTPGGYFAGMVDKARAGVLHLDRTIWGIRTKNHNTIIL